MDYILYSVPILLLLFDLNEYYILPYCHSLIFLSCLFSFFFFLVTPCFSRFSLNAWRGEMDRLFIYGDPRQLKHYDYIYIYICISAYYVKTS